MEVKPATKVVGENRTHTVMHFNLGKKGEIIYIQLFDLLSITAPSWHQKRESR